MRNASVAAAHMTPTDQVADLPFFPCTEAVVHTGHRGRRAEPNAGSRAPGVRPHRMILNTGRAQCARTPRSMQQGAGRHHRPHNPARDTLKKAENATVGKTKLLIFHALESAVRNFSVSP